jgi:hypothetical protein
LRRRRRERQRCCRTMGHHSSRSSRPTGAKQIVFCSTNASRTPMEPRRYFLGASVLVVKHCPGQAISGQRLARESVPPSGDRLGPVKVTRSIFRRSARRDWRAQSATQSAEVCETTPKDSQKIRLVINTKTGLPLRRIGSHYPRGGVSGLSPNLLFSAACDFWFRIETSQYVRIDRIDRLPVSHGLQLPFIHA